MMITVKLVSGKPRKRYQQKLNLQRCLKTM